MNHLDIVIEAAKNILSELGKLPKGSESSIIINNSIATVNQIELIFSIIGLFSIAGFVMFLEKEERFDMNNDMKYILFSSPFCVACKPVKEFLSRSEINGQQIDASEDEGSDLAIRFSVTSLPTVILLNDKDQEIGRCHSVNEIRGILG